MRKILSMLLALPLMAAFIACSSDDDITPTEPEQPASKTVTFIAAIDPQTRVTYSDVNNNLKCSWDESDKGKTVTFISSGDSKEYKFTISDISNGGSTATLTYNGKDFPSSFNGTATYEVATVDQVQSANGSLTANVAEATAHLSNGAKLVAKLTDLTSDGVQSIQFSNVGTTFFRVAIKAPTGGITSGSKLVVRANGQAIGDVTLNFGVTENNTLVAYLRATTQEDATRMSYTIIQGDDTYSYKSVFSARHNLEEGKYYYTDLTSKTAYYNKKEVFEALGNASVDVQPIDLGIYLDEDEVLTENVSQAKYKLLIGDRLLGASTPSGTDCLYFYWGETVGHRVDASYQLEQNAGETGFAYAEGKNEAGNIYKKKTITDLKREGYIREDTKNVSADGYVLVDSRDAAKQQLGGGWRMMSNKEARAFYNKVINTDGYEFVNITEGCGCLDYDDEVTPVNRLKSLQVKKNGIVVWEQPMVGSIDGTTLAFAYYHHKLITMNITGFTWSRDAYNVSGNVIQAYCYGPQDDPKKRIKINYLYGQTTTNGVPDYNKTFIYYGLPILPCMVVEINK